MNSNGNVIGGDGSLDDLFDDLDRRVADMDDDPLWDELRKLAEEATRDPLLADLRQEVDAAAAFLKVGIEVSYLAGEAAAALGYSVGNTSVDPVECIQRMQAEILHLRERLGQ